MPKNDEWAVVIDEEELDRQIARGKALYDDYVAGKPVATSYKYDPIRRIVSIRAKDGSRIDFPVWKIRELQNATDKEIQKGYITQAGDAIHWDELDAHYTVAGLAANIFGTKEWMRELARTGGRSTSPAKAQAARLNGQKGGRPSLTPKPAATVFHSRSAAAAHAKKAASKASSPVKSSAHRVTSLSKASSRKK